MVTVTIAWGAGKYRHDDLRPEGPHHRHHVAENRVLGPVRVRLLGCLGKAEVVGARKELASSIETARREQLLRANHAEQYAQLVANEILSAVAPREREIARLHLPSARQPCDELRVLVVRMRTDDEYARGDVESGHRFAQHGCAAHQTHQEARRSEGKKTNEKLPAQTLHVRPWSSFASRSMVRE